MSPRLKFQAAAKPLFLAGALWGAGVAGPLAVAGRPQTPPPCGPDGACIPNPATYGWYQTRWRTFPGDQVTKGPSEAEKAAEGKKESLGGPQLPPKGEEGMLGPERPKRGDRSGAEAPGEAPAEGPDDVEDLPGLPPLPRGDAAEGAVPGGEAPGAVPPPAGGTLPGAEPEKDPLDPFGMAPPPTPPWLSTSLTNPAAANLQPLPSVELPATSGVLPVGHVESAMESEVISDSSPMGSLLDGPNLHGDDAPPMLPATLKSISPAAPPTMSHSQAAGPPVLPPAVSRMASASMAQPASVRPVNVQPTASSVQPMASGVVQQASAVMPAGGYATDAAEPFDAMVEDQGARQAIYFEATDAE